MTAEETSTMWFYLIASLILVVGSCSFVTNIAILTMYKKMFTTKKSRLFNMNLVSLTISDIGIVIVFPLELDACFNLGWRMSETACVMAGFLDGVFAYAQMFTLTAIAMEKYFIIRSPRSVNPQVQLIVIKILAVWGLAVLLSGLPFLGFGSYPTLDGIEISCAFDYHDRSILNRSYIIASVIFGFILPIFAISFCYTGIFRIARASLNKMNKGNKLSQEKEEKKRKLEMKLAKTTAVSIICFVISWAPYASIATMGVFGKRVPPVAETFSAVFAKFSSALNAVIYVYNHPQFKSAILKKGAGAETGASSSKVRMTSVNEKSEDK